MRKASVIALVFISGLAAFVLAVAPPAWSAKEKDKDKKAAPSGRNLPPGVALNACGCYKSGNGCVCTDRKAKCECPGECEPVGCEEKRQKDLEREYAAEVKRAQEEDKKRKAAEEAAEAKASGDAPEDSEKEKEPEKAAEKTADKSGEKPASGAAATPAPKGKPAKPKK